MSKDWHAGVVTIKGRLYIQFKDPKWKQRATGLIDNPENQVAARALAAEAERQVKAREKLRRESADSVTLRAYCSAWLKGRTGTSAVDEKQRLEQHVLPVLGDVLLADLNAVMVRDLVRALVKKPSRKGDILAPRTVLNVYGVLMAVCAEAVVEGKMHAVPRLTRKHLPVKRDKDPTFRDESIFTLEEVLQLVTSQIVPHDRRVFYALLFLGCMRFGEASEVRWRDYEAQLEPRPKLKVLRSYNTRLGIVKGTKAERPRHVPAVGLLAKMLAEWKLKGWREFSGQERQPGPDDLIVPSRRGDNRSANHMLKKFHQDLIRLGLTDVDERGEAIGRERRQHDSRRTWFSRVMAEGANEAHARWTAWGPPPEIWADYTTMAWDTLCEVVHGIEVAIKRAQRARRRA